MGLPLRRHLRTCDDVIFMRNSANPDGPTLTLTRDERRAFLAGTKDGSFDEL